MDRKFTDREDIATDLEKTFQPQGIVKFAYEYQKKNTSIREAILDLLSQYVATRSEDVDKFVTIHTIEEELLLFRAKEGLL